MSTKKSNAFERSAGILLPLSSLPSPYGIGAMGEDAYRFIDFLHASGQKFWQVLPVGPTSYGDSPYQSFSAFAGNPYFIDLAALCKEGLIEKKKIDKINWGANEHKVDYARVYEIRFKVLREAYTKSSHKDEPEYLAFCSENADWLDDYCLFMSVKGRFDNVEWLKWDDDIRTRKPEALKKYKDELSEEIGFWKFIQYKFFQQWKKLRDYAHDKSVSIIGDIPIYIAMDSADAWANTDQFWMDEEKRPVKVSGVPPDYFSKTGQLWGNPLYRWDVMESDGFKWWKRRISFSSGIYDVIRIDHFIGTVRYYTIDADSPTAVGGEWLTGPGMKLIDAIDEARGDTRIIAEDLGELVPAVRKVRVRSGYPGMKVLQFAFNDNSDNSFLPHNIESDFIAYTGTHDNDTVKGYMESLRGARGKAVRKYAREYLGIKRNSEIVDAVIRAAFGSVAIIAIIPIQDWLHLGSESRINIPSTVGGNWEWRMDKGCLTKELSAKIADFTRIYGR